MRRRLRGLRGTARRAVAQAQQTLAGPSDPSTTIVVAGTGRSGTSWLARLIATLPGIQYLFEPLNPNTVPAIRPLYPAGLRTTRYLPPTTNDPQIEHLLRAALQGRVRSAWTDLEAGVWWPQRYLMKEVRATMMLGYLSNTFRPRIIYIVRHPGAVVASRVAHRFDGTTEDLLKQEALVDTHLSPWVDEMRRVTAPVDIHAIRWAVENHVAHTELATRPHFRIHYEDLLLAPQLVLRELFQWLDEPQPARINELLSQPSPTSYERSRYQDAFDRLARWQQQMGQDDLRTILTWAERFELPWYNDSPLPL